MSTVLQEPVVTNPEEYKQPVVHIGMTVLWYAEGKKSGTPRPAIVVKLVSNSRYIELWCPDLQQRKRCVRHMTDPELQRQTAMTRRDGGWDYTDYDKALIRGLGSKAPRRAPDPPKPGLTPLPPVPEAPNGEPDKK